MPMFKRSSANPILLPNSKNSWENKATFNGCPAQDGDKMHFLYRAIGSDNVSTIGCAESLNGAKFKNRRQFLQPEFDWEKYGCEDPRVTKLGSSYYIFYTALSEYPFRAEGIKLGLAVTKDFKTYKKYSVTNFNSKAMALFPGKIGKKMVAILTANTDSPPAKIGLAFFDTPQQMTSPAYWNKWYKNVDKHRLVIERAENDHVEVGAPPLKTKYGWLLFYSYIQNYFTPPATFGIEAILLDLNDPSKIIKRTTKPLLTSETDYEKFGNVPNISFPSGAILTGDKIDLYYGVADTACAVASCSLKELLKEMS